MATTSQCEKAINLYEEKLTHLKNVIGLGVVPADGAEEGTRPDMAVAVYVRRKLARERLSPEDMVPTYLEVPGRGRTPKVRVPTKVIEQGDVKLEHA